MCATFGGRLRSAISLWAGTGPRSPRATRVRVNVSKTDSAIVRPVVAGALIVGLMLALSTAVWINTGRNSGGPGNPPSPPAPGSPACAHSVGLCVERKVTRVIDGDTVEIEGGLRVRLVLVDAPETTDIGGSEATNYLTALCLGQSAVVDEDDWQIGADPYGRTLAVIHCAGTNANAAMISSGRADTYRLFCSRSEFGSEAWTRCASPPPPPPPGNCDPAYPEVCIPSPPPDLNCADIAFRNFQVLLPDPHHFDGDGDGVGCEG